MGDDDTRSIAVDEKDYNSVLDAVKRGAPSTSIRPLIEAWRLESLHQRLNRVGEQLAKTVERVGKGQVEVDVTTPRIYLAREELGEFWSVFSHVIRNAAVHGLVFAARSFFSHVTCAELASRVMLEFSATKCQSPTSKL